MAHYKRKYPRSTRRGHYSRNALQRRLGLEDEEILWFSNHPRAHDKLFHTRPARHRCRALERAALKGEDVEAMCWPDGRKPFVYYW